MSTAVELASLTSGGFAVQGDNAGDKAGFSVSAVGDFNGDGFDDLIVGAPLNDAGGTNSGAVYLLYGHAGGFSAIDLSNPAAGAGFKIIGDHDGDTAGLNVAGAGDVNGDGFDDIILEAGQPGMLGYGIGNKAYVIFGHAGGSQTVDLSNLAASAGVVINGPFTNKDGSVAAAGDVNGDGFADVVIASPELQNTHLGAAYVIFGKASGFGAVDINNLGANGFLVDASHGTFAVGQSVASAGDVNGDGFDDLIIGAQSSGFYYGYGATPSAFVIFGKETGFGTVDLSALAPSAGFQIKGGYSYGNYSFAVSGAGDINGDGFADIVVGRAYDNGRAGAAYVVYGKASGFGTIDVTNLAPDAGFAIHGVAAQDLAGLSVAAAGDVNGDGFADIMIGAPLADAGGIDAGAAYLIFGRAGGFAAIDLANLSPSVGITFLGDAPDDRAGFSVSGAGDLNGDGFADLIVGAPYNDAGGENAGKAYVIFGAAELQSHAHNDFNGDGVSDVLWQNDNRTVREWLGQAPNGAFVGNSANVNFLAAAGSHVIGTGDFNGDGRVDSLWQTADGRVTDLLGQPSGGFVDNSAKVGIFTGLEWHAIGTGDFNGDGLDDVLWQNDNGTVRDWLGQADGSFAGNVARVNFVAAAGSHMVGTGDFNGDGCTDMLWQTATASSSTSSAIAAADSPTTARRSTSAPASTGTSSVPAISTATAATTCCCATTTAPSANGSARATARSSATPPTLTSCPRPASTWSASATITAMASTTFYGPTPVRLRNRSAPRPAPSSTTARR